MKLSLDLAAIHGYLCADGYVIRNPPYQKHKYYRIGLRNTCLSLLEDFKVKCEKVFNTKPIVYRRERCGFGSKKIYYELTKNDSFYSDEWGLPKLNIKQLKLWLRAYFDCDGWIFVKGRQNRHIGLDSINHKGLEQIRKALKRFEIESKIKEIKNRKIFRLHIYKKQSLINFEKNIGFLHPNKRTKLKQVIDSYIDYKWRFPENEIMLKKFVVDLMSQKVEANKIDRIRITSILNQNLTNLANALNDLFCVESKIYGPSINGCGTRYYELVIQKKTEISKIRELLYFVH